MWLHLAFLALATVLTWVWTSHPVLSFYTLQLIAGLIILYFAKNLVNKFGSNEMSKASKATKYIDATILTIIILLLVFSSGGINSSLFFLFYFLLFGISFLFEPSLSISFTVILIIFLAFQLQTNEDLLKIISLVFVAPLALFFGQQYLQNLASQKRIKIFKEKWLKNEKSIEIQETDVLLWLSLNLRSTLSEIGEITAELLSAIGQLSPPQKKLIEKIRKKTKKLLKEGKKLKVKIDEQTDEKN